MVTGADATRKEYSVESTTQIKPMLMRMALVMPVIHAPLALKKNAQSRSPKKKNQRWMTKQMPMMKNLEPPLNQTPPLPMIHTTTATPQRFPLDAKAAVPALKAALWGSHGF